MAFDQRFAVVLVGSSGEGGAKLHRRNWGEAVENLTGSGEYHWMAGNFLKYGAAEATFGSKNAGDLPGRRARADRAVRAAADLHQLRRAREGRREWLDHQGSFMAAVAAQPVFRLLGAQGPRRSDDYATEKMPAVNVGCSTASSPGGSTTAATPTGRTGILHPMGRPDARPLTGSGRCGDRRRREPTPREHERDREHDGGPEERGARHDDRRLIRHEERE